MNIQKTVLSTGLTVITANLPGFETVAVLALINAGSSSETHANNGIAHFLEHQNFKGTSTRTSKEISSSVENLGANINAYTSHTNTCYHITGLHDHTEQYVSILGDILSNSVYDQAEIVSEGGVILQEIAQYLDVPNSVAWDGIGSVAYSDQPFGRTILGNPDFVKNAKTDDFKNFTNEFYTTGNMVIVGAGNVVHEDFCSMVAEHFKNLPVAPRAILRSPVYTGGAYVLEDDYQQINSILSFNSVEVYDPNSEAHSIFAEAFGGGMSSPLFQEVREKRGLCYSVYAGRSSGDGHGQFYVGGGMTPENVDEYMDVVCDQLNKARIGINLVDMNRAKSKFIVGLRTVQERPFQIASFLAGKFLLHDRIVYPRENIEKIASVTLDDLAAAANQLLNSKPSLSMVGPKFSKDYYAEIVANF